MWRKKAGFVGRWTAVSESGDLRDLLPRGDRQGSFYLAEQLLRAGRAEGDDEFAKLRLELRLASLDRLLAFFGHESARGFVRSRADVVDVRFRDDHALFCGPIHNFTCGHAAREIANERSLVTLTHDM